MKRDEYYNKHRHLSFDELSIKHNTTTGLIRYCLLVKLNKDCKLSDKNRYFFFFLKYRKKSQKNIWDFEKKNETVKTRHKHII